MPIELHERLSEFSYGFGVTREVERALASVGVTAVPFLPSLLHEAKLGFDVGFDLPGVPLLLQFKLGQAMKRFVPGPGPHLTRPFWRFHTDTAEPDGQYELLLKAETDGAKAYYVAPKFHDWEAYLKAYTSGAIIASSLLVTPGEIRKLLDAHSILDGKHKIVYDTSRAYLCSEPVPMEVVEARQFAGQLRQQIESSEVSLGQTLRAVFDGFPNRAVVRRPRHDVDLPLLEERQVYAIPSDTDEEIELRQLRFTEYQRRAVTADDAVAAAVGAEVWAFGIQLVLAFVKK